MFAFAYKLFPEEFSPINGVQTTIKRQMQTNELLESLCIKAPHRALYHLWFQKKQIWVICFLNHVTCWVPRIEWSVYKGVHTHSIFVPVEQPWLFSWKPGSCNSFLLLLCKSNHVLSRHIKQSLKLFMQYIMFWAWYKSDAGLNKKYIWKSYCVLYVFLL